MKRHLLLLTTCVAMLALCAGGCKKKPKDEKTPEGGMEAMAKAMEAMGRPMGAKPAKPAAMKAAKPAAMKAVATDTAPKAGGEVKITKKALVAGTKIFSTEKTKMYFTLEVKGKKIKFTNASDDVRMEEILAVKGSAITKMKVSFKTQKKIGSQGGKIKTTIAPIAGKTFMLEAKGGKVVVTDDKGKPADAKMAKAVLKKYKLFGKPDKMFDAIPTTPIKVGAKVPAIEAALKESLKEEMASGEKAEAFSMSNVSVTLKGLKGKLALFAVTMTIAIKKGAAFSLTMHMKGIVTVDTTTGQEQSMIFTGPLDVMGKKNVGQMTRVETKTYTK